MERVIEILSNQNTWYGALALALVSAMLYDLTKGAATKLRDEVSIRIRIQKQRDDRVKPDNDEIFRRDIDGATLCIYSGNIKDADVQVVVSSDDTLLSASGGVARAIVKSAGRSIQKRLAALAKGGLSRGTIAITDGGRSKFKYIFHAIVLTRGQFTAYPSSREIETLVRNIVTIADSVGVNSLALPILASGTAAKDLKDIENLTDQDITYLVVRAAADALKSRTKHLRELFVVVFDKKTLPEDLSQKLA